MSVSQLINYIKAKDFDSFSKTLKNCSKNDLKNIVEYKDSNGDTVSHFLVKLCERKRNSISELEKQLKELKTHEEVYNKMTHSILNDFKGVRSANNEGFSIFSEEE